MLTTEARRAIACRLLALVLGIGMAVGAAEIALRRVLPARTRACVWPPGTQWIVDLDPAVMPGVRGPSRFTINAEGIRGDVPGPEGERRILAIGGSTTECLYLDDSRAWPALVQQALTGAPGGPRVWVGNAGKSGANSRDHLLVLRQLADVLPRIDTTIVLVGVNDLTAALAQGDDYRTPPPLTEPEELRRQMRHTFSILPGRPEDPADGSAPASVPWFKRTAIYQLGAASKRGAKNRMAAPSAHHPEVTLAYGRWREHRRHAAALRDALPDLEAPLRDYRDALRALVDLAAARRIRIVLATQPTLWRGDLPPGARDLLWLGGIGDFQEQPGQTYYAVGALAEAMRRYNDVTREVCRERGLDCLDLAARIPADTTMFFDDCHFTDEGARAVAAAVTEHLGRPSLAAR